MLRTGTMNSARCLLAFLTVLLTAGVTRAQVVPVDTTKSKVIVHVFKAGLFGGFAHNHEIAAPVQSGTIDASNRSVELRFDARRMKVLDPDLPPDKREEVQSTMLSSKVLDAEKFPEIRFVSRSVTLAGASAYRAEGDLTLHGTTRPIAVPVSVVEDHYVATVRLKQTDFGIQPVSLFGGTVKVKDEVEIRFEIFPTAR